MAADCNRGGAHYVLITKPTEEYPSYNPSVININIGLQNNRTIRGPLHCCPRCVKHLTDHHELYSLDDILGYVHASTYYTFVKWKEINRDFQCYGYVVLRDEEFKAKLKQLKLMRLLQRDKCVNEIIDVASGMKASSLFTIKTLEKQIEKVEEKRRQW